MPSSIVLMNVARGARLTAALLAAVLVVAACGDDNATTDTTDAIQFGEGTIPNSVPADFPIPADSVVGTTLVDKINNRTEFQLTIVADMTSTVQFFQVGLVNQGYIIDSSEGNSVAWTVTFSNGEIRGEILITPQTGQVSTSVVSVNRS